MAERKSCGKYETYHAKKRKMQFRFTGIMELDLLSKDWKINVTIRDLE